MGGPRAFYIVPDLFYHVNGQRTRLFHGDSTSAIERNPIRNKPLMA
jgi:hypothetical protein